VQFLRLCWNVAFDRFSPMTFSVAHALLLLTA